MLTAEPGPSMLSGIQRLSIPLILVRYPDRIARHLSFEVRVSSIRMRLQHLSIPPQSIQLPGLSAKSTLIQCASRHPSQIGQPAKAVLSELMSQTQMDNIPTRRQSGNQVFVISDMLTPNLNRGLLMTADTRQRQPTENVLRFGSLSNLAHCGAN